MIDQSYESVIKVLLSSMYKQGWTIDDIKEFISQLEYNPDFVEWLKKSIANRQKDISDE